MNAHDEEDGPHSYQLNPTRSEQTPTSPPPSFRSHSRSASPSSRRLLHDDPLRNDDDQTLADAFGDEDGSDDENEPDDRQRLMRANPDAQSPTDNGPAATASSSSEARTDGQEQPRAPAPPRRTNILPRFLTRSFAANQSLASSNDGVFANLAAKPERGDKNEDLPPVS